MDNEGGGQLEGHWRWNVYKDSENEDNCPFPFTSIALTRLSWNLGQAEDLEQTCRKNDIEKVEGNDQSAVTLGCDSDNFPVIKSNERAIARKLSYISSILARSVLTDSGTSNYGREISVCSRELKCLQWALRTVRVDPYSVQAWTWLSYILMKNGCLAYAKKAALCATQAATTGRYIEQVPSEWRIAPILTFVNLSIIFINSHNLTSAHDVLAEAKLHVPLYCPKCPAWNACLALLNLCICVDQANDPVSSDMSLSSLCKALEDNFRIAMFALTKRMHRRLGQPTLLLRPQCNLGLSDRFAHIAIETLGQYVKLSPIRGMEFIRRQSIKFFRLLDFLTAVCARADVCNMQNSHQVDVLEEEPTYTSHLLEVNSHSMSAIADENKVCGNVRSHDETKQVSKNEEQFTSEESSVHQTVNEMITRICLKNAELEIVQEKRGENSSGRSVIERNKLILASALELQGNFSAAYSVYCSEAGWTDQHHPLRDKVTASKVRCLSELRRYKQALQLCRQAGPNTRKEMIICLKRLGKIEQASALAKQESKRAVPPCTASKMDASSWAKVSELLEMSSELGKPFECKEDKGQGNQECGKISYLHDWMERLIYLTGKPGDGDIKRDVLVTLPHSKLSVDMRALVQYSLAGRCSDVRFLLKELVYSCSANKRQLRAAHLLNAQYDSDCKATRTGSQFNCLSNLADMHLLEERVLSLSKSIRSCNFFAQDMSYCGQQAESLWQLWQNVTEQIKSGEGRINKKPLNLSEIFPMSYNVVSNEESDENHTNMQDAVHPINHGVVESELSNIAHSLFGVRNFSMDSARVEEVHSTNRLDVHLAHMYPDRFLHRLRRSR